MFDTHTHTNNSPDSKQTIDELCISSIEKGISAISVTDHVNMENFEETNTFNRIKQSLDDVNYAKVEYKGNLEIYKGVEISGYYHSPFDTEKFLKSFDFDVIIGSVHFAEYKSIDTFYSAVDFSLYDKDYINSFLSEYFKNLKMTAENMDFDILAHLTCPLRYINGKYKKEISLEGFDDTINEIIYIITERNISLEVNTSGIFGDYGKYFPDESIIKKYYDMGGRSISIGSDAHCPQNVGIGFKEAKAMLKEIGFENYCYYTKRERKLAKL